MGTFKQCWIIDTEFYAPPGERPTPICLVAYEMMTEKTVRHWMWDDPDTAPPFSIDDDSLFVAYFASAEWGVFLAAGWPLPTYTIDLFAEFRARTNGRPPVAGNGLLGALTAFGLDHLAVEEKDEYRGLAIRGGPYSAEERQALLTYCESDVQALAQLWAVMLPGLDWARALDRGRYVKAVALMERHGVPVDADGLRSYQACANEIGLRLIERIDPQYGVFEDGSFKQDRFAAYLRLEGISWPKTPTGRLVVEDDLWRSKAKAHPQLNPLRELLLTRNQLKLADLAVGLDGRTRCLLSPFASKTGRNQPSNSKFIFGPARWIRGFIQPPPGYGLAYVDWVSAELGIAAALSGDANLQAAYRSPDPYLHFAQLAKAVPPDATKQSHPVERERFKVAALAAQYGAGPQTIADQLGEGIAWGRYLLEAHKVAFPDLWRWLGAVVDHAFSRRYLRTEPGGWPLQITSDTKPTTAQNFLVQATCADILRLACCLITEAGIEVCAPIHDALLIAAPLSDLDAAVAQTQDLMREASVAVLGDFELFTDAEIVRYPNRYLDERGQEMFDTVQELLAEIGAVK